MRQIGSLGGKCASIYDRLTSTIDANGGVTQYRYDNSGNRVQLTDASFNTTRWQFDAQGQVLSETDANRLSIVNEYDLVGNIAAVTDRRVNGGEKLWRLAGRGGRLNRAAPICSVVDFVIRWKAVIMAGFRVNNPEETSDAGVYRHGYRSRV